jgi:hypothetical protein
MDDSDSTYVFRAFSTVELLSSKPREDGMRRNVKLAAVGIVSMSLVVLFFLAPVVKAGQSCDCITSLGASDAPHAIYSSASCATVGFGDSLWKGSIYLTCSPPVPKTD